MSPDTFSNIVAINVYFETLSKKEQKQCIEYLKSLDINTTDLEMRMK